jgi:DNA-binding NarL/FixJ family response regulator
MRVMIIEDEILIGRFIQQLLKNNLTCESLVVITSEEAKQEIPTFLPHLILCDINLHDTHDGIELIQDLRSDYHFETIFVTSYHTRSIVERATLTRPANYIVKPIDATQFAIAMSLVQKRLENYQEAGTAKENIAQKLSKSEYNILQMISNNMTTNEIALRLFISVRTVRNHRHNISQKLELPADNNSLVKWAIENRQHI